MPALCRASAMALPFRSSSPSADVHEIDQREDEHLHQSHKVPVETGRLDVAGVQSIAVESHGDDTERDHTANYVQQVQARDPEERRPKEYRPTQWILRHPPARTDHVGPFVEEQ